MQVDAEKDKAIETQVAPSELDIESLPSRIDQERLEKLREQYGVCCPLPLFLHPHISLTSSLGNMVLSNGPLGPIQLPSPAQIHNW